MFRAVSDEIENLSSSPPPLPLKLDPILESDPVESDSDDDHVGNVHVRLSPPFSNTYTLGRFREHSSANPNLQIKNERSSMSIDSSPAHQSRDHILECDPLASYSSDIAIPLKRTSPTCLHHSTHLDFDERNSTQRETKYPEWVDHDFQAHSKKKKFQLVQNELEKAAAKGVPKLTQKSPGDDMSQRLSERAGPLETQFADHLSKYQSNQSIFKFHAFQNELERFYFKQTHLHLTQVAPVKNGWVCEGEVTSHPDRDWPSPPSCPLTVLFVALDPTAHHPHASLAVGDRVTCFDFTSNSDGSLYFSTEYITTKA